MEIWSGEIKFMPLELFLFLLKTMEKPWKIMGSQILYDVQVLMLMQPLIGCGFKRTISAFGGNPEQKKQNKQTKHFYHSSSSLSDIQKAN